MVSEVFTHKAIEWHVKFSLKQEHILNVTEEQRNRGEHVLGWCDTSGRRDTVHCIETISKEGYNGMGDLVENPHS